MDHKKALEVLINLSKKPSLRAEEKEAILIAIGVLSWTSLAQSRIKAIKAKREKNN
jgi:hypothetical protein